MTISNKYLKRSETKFRELVGCQKRAICCYHKMDDFFVGRGREIPEQVLAIRDDYSVYFGH